MPYISKNRLYTDRNPLEPDFSGKVLEEGDEAARFTLVGEGSTLTDEEAEKYGLVGYKGVSKVKEDGDSGDDEAEAETIKTVTSEPKAEKPKASKKAATKSK